LPFLYPQALLVTVTDQSVEPFKDAGVKIIFDKDVLLIDRVNGSPLVARLITNAVTPSLSKTVSASLLPFAVAVTVIVPVVESPGSIAMLCVNKLESVMVAVSVVAALPDTFTCEFEFIVMFFSLY